MPLNWINNHYIKFRGAYYTQELNMNFLFASVRQHIQDGMTECRC